MGWSNREGTVRLARSGCRWVMRALPVGVTAGVGASLLAAAPMPLQSGQLAPHGIALVIAFLVISLGIHEAAHAWVAWKCGDPTAKDLGRITLNPIPHIDPFMTILLPAVLALRGGFIFGGAKPVPVAYHRLRSPLRDMALVALAGPASNFVLTLVFLTAWKASIVFGGYTYDQLLPMVLEQSAFYNALLTVFNLMPVPPLDGSRVMAWLLPSSIRDSYVAIERYGMILVVILVFMVPQFQALLWGGITEVMSLADMLTGGTW